MSDSELSPPPCSVDLIERIAKDSFHSPFVGPYTSELRRVLNAPTGSVHDTMIRDLYRRLARLYSSANAPAVARKAPQAGGSASRCPACGLGEHGKDALCDHHYAEYLGQQLGSHSDVPDDGQTRYTPNA